MVACRTPSHSPHEDQSQTICIAALVDAGADIWQISPLDNQTPFAAYLHHHILHPCPQVLDIFLERIHTDLRERWPHWNTEKRAQVNSTVQTWIKDRIWMSHTYVGQRIRNALHDVSLDLLFLISMIEECQCRDDDVCCDEDGGEDHHSMLHSA
jgi:hypothetical protein